MTHAADVKLTEANEESHLAFFVFPVTGECECPRASQGHFESKYLPWCTVFTRVVGVFADFLGSNPPTQLQNSSSAFAGAFRGGAPRSALVSRIRAVTCFRGLMHVLKAASCRCLFFSLAPGLIPNSRTVDGALK